MAEPVPPDAAMSAVEVVRALWLAQRAGDVDALLVLVHPEVVWRPIDPAAGAATYRGHEGTRRLLADYAAALGPFRMDFHAMTELHDGRVLATGRLVTYDEHGDEVGQDVEAYFTVRDGMVAEIDTGPPGGHDTLTPNV